MDLIEIDGLHPPTVIGCREQLWRDCYERSDGLANARNHPTAAKALIACVHLSRGPTAGALADRVSRTAAAEHQPNASRFSRPVGVVIEQTAAGSTAAASS